MSESASAVYKTNGGTERKSKAVPEGRGDPLASRCSRRPPRTAGKVRGILRIHVRYGNLSALGSAIEISLTRTSRPRDRRFTSLINVLLNKMIHFSNGVASVNALEICPTGC